jgi:hypothetical protein
MMSNNKPLTDIDLAAEVNGVFDASSETKGQEPELVVIMGGVAVGKTRMRRDKFKNGYVVLDAGDIFIRLSCGKYIDFPAVLEEPMESIGAVIARRAVHERRNIVVEIIGAKYDPVKHLIEAFKSIDYRVSVIAVTADLEKSLDWNLNRSDNNISAYYTEPYHRKWLLDAAAALRK